MTEKEILQRQEGNGNKEFYLMLVGSFYHACGNGAFALARLMHYRVMRKHRKWGDVLVCGFPARNLCMVEDEVKKIKGFFAASDDGRICRFAGVDGTPDEEMVCEPVPVAQKQDGESTLQSVGGIPLVAVESVIEKLRGFNISASTPVDAMVLLSELQGCMRTA